MSNGRVTISDIATQAGVSKAAAWSALSKRKTSIVLGKATKEKIIKLAKELNYQPNLSARSLAKQKSFLISFLCRETFAKNTSILLRGMQDVLLDDGYSVLVYAHGDSVTSEVRNLRHAVARQSEALIVTPAFESDGRCNTQEFSRLHESGVPVVQLFSNHIKDIPSITADSYQPGKVAVEHLLKKGHRRIVHLTVDGYRDEESPGYLHALRKRWSGYEDTMKEAGLEPCILAIDGEVDYARGAFDIARGIIGHSYRPTAVVAYNDTIAFGLMKGLADAGVRVPEDISIIGHDGIEQMLLSCPMEETMTTFVQPMREIGRMAAQMCAGLIDGKEVKDFVYENKFSPGISVAPMNGHGG